MWICYVNLLRVVPAIQYDLVYRHHTLRDIPYRADATS